MRVLGLFAVNGLFATDCATTQPQTPNRCVLSPVHLFGLVLLRIRDGEGCRFE